MLLLNCALKLVEEIILYYDSRSKKHQMYLYMFIIQELRLCCSVVEALTCLGCYEACVGSCLPTMWAAYLSDIDP